MIPSMSIERYNKLENQFYDYFSQVSKLFNDPDGFITFLTEDTGFFELPATTHANCNYRAGLLEHTLNVIKTLANLNYFIANKKYTLEKCILHGLFYNIKFSYYNGNFPFIYDLDNFWIENENVNLSDLLSNDRTEFLNFIDEYRFDSTFEFKVLLNFAESWVSMHEPYVSYKNLETEELILPDDYL